MTQAEFTRQVRQMRPMLVGVAHHILGNDQEAEDVVQDALLRLWTLHEEVTNLPGMARVVVRNRSLDIVRRRTSHVSLERLELPDGLADELADEAQDGHLERMMRLVSELPSMQQTVLRLRHVDGLSMPDIARLVGTSEVAVRQSLSRARRTVRRRMRLTMAASLVAIALFTALYLGLRPVPASQTTQTFSFIPATSSPRLPQDTPREQYARYMEERRTQTNTYQQLKRLAHEKD